MSLLNEGRSSSRIHIVFWAVATLSLVEIFTGLEELILLKIFDDFDKENHVMVKLVRLNA